jgi:hypothetical protein
VPSPISARGEWTTSQAPDWACTHGTDRHRTSNYASSNPHLGARSADEVEQRRSKATAILWQHCKRCLGAFESGNYPAQTSHRPQECAGTTFGAQHHHRLIWTCWQAHNSLVNEGQHRYPWTVREKGYHVASLMHFSREMNMSVEPHAALGRLSTLLPDAVLLHPWVTQ